VSVLNINLNSLINSALLKPLFRIRFGLNTDPDPDPALKVNTDPDPANNVDKDPDPDRGFFKTNTQKIFFKLTVFFTCCFLDLC